MGTPPSDHLPFQGVEPVNYMSYGETLQWLHNTTGAPAAKGEGPYSDSYYAAYPCMLFLLYYFIVLRRRLSTNVCGSTTRHLAPFLI